MPEYDHVETVGQTVWAWVPNWKAGQLPKYWSALRPWGPAWDEGDVVDPVETYYTVFHKKQQPGT